MEDTLLILLMFGDAKGWPRLGLCCSWRDAVETRAGWLWDTEGEEGSLCVGRCPGSWDAPSKSRHTLVALWFHIPNEERLRELGQS